MISGGVGFSDAGGDGLSGGVSDFWLQVNFVVLSTLGSEGSFSGVDWRGEGA